MSPAVAAARRVALRHELPPGPLAVVRLDRTQVHVTVLDGPAGPVLATRRHRFDEHRGGVEPSVAALVAAAADIGRVPAELTGGVVLCGPCADTPGTRAALAAVAGEPPWSDADPRAATPEPAAPEPAADRRPVLTGAGGPAAAGRSPGSGAGDRLGAGLLPVPPRRRRVGPSLATALVVVSVWVLVGALVSGVDRWATAARPAPPGTELAQYDYSLRLPAGWRHSGGLPERRRILLTPATAPAGSDLISVEQTPLGYDSAAERDRAYRELHARFLRAVADGEALDELTPSTRFAGREVISYRQRHPLGGTRVDWYVVFDRDSQLSVGCQYTASGAVAVRAACAEVVGSLARRPVPSG